MNFLYLYPCYSEARKAFTEMYNMSEDCKADLTNLRIDVGSDTHRFNYVPIKVYVDVERLCGLIGIVHIEPVIEELLNKVAEIKKLILFTTDISATREYERTRSNPSTKLQTPDAPPAGGTADGSAPELGSKTISGDALLQGRFDF